MQTSAHILHALLYTYKVCLEPDLETDAPSRRFCIMHCLCANLNILGHLVVVGGGEGLEIAEAVNGNGVFGGRETDGAGVAGDCASRDVVRRLTANKEAVPADNGVGGECGALHSAPVK